MRTASLVLVLLALVNGLPAQRSLAQDAPALAIDAAPSGNSADTVASIDSCTSVHSGDTFQVDLVVTGVTDLLAFETYVQYDVSVIQVIGRDVRRFLGGDEGSVFDTSGPVPDEKGRFRIGGANISEGAQGVSGMGVLARLKMKAVGKGTTTVDAGLIDLNGDGKPDIGPTLADIDGKRIGDTNKDSFFDGPVTAAQVAVDGDCAEVLSTPVASPAPDVSANPANDGNSVEWWLFAAIGGTAAAAVVAAGGLYWVRSKSSHDGAGGGEEV